MHYCFSALKYKIVIEKKSKALIVILIMHSTKTRQFNHAVVINEGWFKLLRYIYSMWGGRPEATLEVSRHSV